MNSQHLDDLKHEARHSDDPDRLRWLANAMQRLGAWDEADRARQKARKIEQEQADRVNA